MSRFSPHTVQIVRTIHRHGPIRGVEVWRTMDGITRQGVYRALDDLEAKGVIRNTSPRGRVPRWDIAPSVPFEYSSLLRGHGTIFPEGTEAILDLLRQQPRTVPAIERLTGMDSTAVRRRIRMLESEGLIRHTMDRTTRNRPAKLWEVVQ